MNGTNFMRVEEVAEELNISKSYAYKIVQMLNAELKEKGDFDNLRRVNRVFYGAYLLWYRTKGVIQLVVYKESKNNTWRVIYRYTDWTGERKQSQKRGFQTKREAQAWEREQLNKLGADLDMTFQNFVERYKEDRRNRIKDSTWESKDHIIRTKLLPYFGRLKMSSITPQQIIRWQNELINYRDKNGKPYSPVYLKTIQNQLSAIFNHAVRYYNLKENPCVKAGSMGKKKSREMLFLDQR